MCLFLYLGSDQPLPLIPWNADKPDFHVSELPPELTCIEQHINLPYVYWTGSEEKCACAFNYGREYPEYQDEPDELTRAERARAKLVEYLKVNRVLKIYPCWADEEEKPIETSESIEIEDIQSETFLFQNRVMMWIKR